MQNITCLEIKKIIAKALEDSNNFGEVLIEEGVPHISYSMISSYEFCEHRYFLEYVKRIKLSPKPRYFITGEVFHDIAATYYNNRSTTPALEDLLKVNSKAKKKITDKALLCKMKNAITLLDMNSWKSYEIVAVEKPFVIRVDQSIPPFVGVVDLILKKDKTFFIIDHKTGNKFNEVDDLQAEIYREFVYKQYGFSKCELYYDQYRWVNNLNRIRKPAFQRTKIKLQKNLRKSSLERILTAYKGMKKILSGREPSYEGLCFMCPY